MKFGLAPTTFNTFNLNRLSGSLPWKTAAPGGSRTSTVPPAPDPALILELGIEEKQAFA
jgi:hypothetical protein